jgi:hypothetical protein
MFAEHTFVSRVVVGHADTGERFSRNVDRFGLLSRNSAPKQNVHRSRKYPRISDCLMQEGPNQKSLRSRTHCDCCEVRAAAAKWSNPADREYRNADRWLSRLRFSTRTDNDGEYTLGERLRPRRFRWCPGRGVLSHCVACDRGILFFACCRNPAGSACCGRGFKQSLICFRT